MVLNERQSNDTKPSLIPSELKLHKKSRVLELVYQDGVSFSLSFEYLRVFSPSAEVRGHGVGQEVLQTGKKDVDLQSISPVGNYALKFSFSDGHQSGIYSWEYLYNLGYNYEENWGKYIQDLDKAGKTREAIAQDTSSGCGGGACGC